MLNNNMNLNYVEGMTVDTMINIKINKIFVEAYKNQFKRKSEEDEIVIAEEIKEEDNNKLIKGFCIAVGCAAAVVAAPAAIMTWQMTGGIRAMYVALAKAALETAKLNIQNPSLISTMFYKL